MCHLNTTVEPSHAPSETPALSACGGRRAWNEGLPFVLSSLAASALLFERSPGASIAASLGGLLCAAFFRDPERHTPNDPQTIYAASDGRVLTVERVVEPWWIGGEADRVAVFLSLTDVHVNRAPVEGRLVAIRRLPGRFAPAFAHAEHNCKDMLALEGPHGRVVVAQISGVLARRSVQWCRPGDRLEAGGRLGMIRFGSRTDIYLPAGTAEILVSPGERVSAGRTRIARYLD